MSNLKATLASLDTAIQSHIAGGTVSFSDLVQARAKLAIIPSSEEEVVQVLQTNLWVARGVVAAITFIVGLIAHWCGWQPQAKDLLWIGPVAGFGINLLARPVAHVLWIMLSWCQNYGKPAPTPPTPPTP